MKDLSEDPSHHKRMLLQRSYILPGGPNELFLVPASVNATGLTKAVVYVSLYVG